MKLETDSKEDLTRKSNIERIISEGSTVSDTIKKLRRFTDFKLVELHSLEGNNLEYFAELADGIAFIDKKIFGEQKNNESTKYIIHRNDEAIVYMLPAIYLYYS